MQWCRFGHPWCLIIWVSLSNMVFFLIFFFWCRFVSETYSIEDCLRYDTNTYNLTPNSAITQIDSISFENSNDGETSWTMKLPSSSCRPVIYVPDTNRYIGFGASGGGYEYIYWYDTTSHEQEVNRFSYNTDYLIKIQKTNGNLLVYVNGTLKKTINGTDAVTGQTLNVGVRNWGSGTGTIKNIKIKPL